MTNTTDQCYDCYSWPDEIIVMTWNGADIKLCPQCAEARERYAEYLADCYADNPDDNEQPPEWEYGDSPDLYD